MRKVYHFILDHLLELACIQVLIIALFPVISSSVAVTAVDFLLFLFLPGFVMGACVAAAYSIYEIGETKLLGINSWRYLIFTLLMGVIGMAHNMLKDDHMNYENLTIYQKVLAPYVGFLLGSMITVIIKISCGRTT